MPTLRSKCKISVHLVNCISPNMVQHPSEVGKCSCSLILDEEERDWIIIVAQKGRKQNLPCTVTGDLFQFDGKTGGKPYLFWNMTFDYLKYLDTAMWLPTRYALVYVLWGTLLASGWAPEAEVGGSSPASASRARKVGKNDRSCFS